MISIAGHGASRFLIRSLALALLFHLAVGVRHSLAGTPQDRVRVVEGQIAETEAQLRKIHAGIASIEATIEAQPYDVSGNFERRAEIRNLEGYKVEYNRHLGDLVRELELAKEKAKAEPAPGKRKPPTMIVRPGNVPAPREGGPPGAPAGGARSGSHREGATAAGPEEEGALREPAASGGGTMTVMEGAEPERPAVRRNRPELTDILARVLYTLEEGTIIARLGLLISFLGVIFLLIVAVNQGTLWGVGILVPLAGPLTFAVLHWSDAKIPFLVHAAGVVLFLVG